eukprot:3105243-Pyramimonas_sp.AAC.1
MNHIIKGVRRGGDLQWAKLPEDCPDDLKIVEWLAERHGVCVIPGTSCGAPGALSILAIPYILDSLYPTPYTHYTLYPRLAIP